MALTESEIQAVAKAVQDVAKAMKQVETILLQTLGSNTALSIDWGLSQAQDALENHPTNPTPYTAAEVSNTIGSLANFDTVHWVTHGGNYQLMLGETPIV